MKSKQKIIVFTVLAVVAVALFFGGRGVIEYTRAAEQAELDAYQAEQQAQLEAARKAELEAAANAPKISLAPVAAVEPTVNAGEKPMPSATVTTEPDGSITITPDFEAQAAAASKFQNPDEKVSANMGGAGGDLPLGSDGVYHGDHSATPAPKATAASTSSPAASVKPSETSQKPTVSQTPTTPAPTPEAATEPPTASQKPNGDDSSSEDKPEVTPKPSQQPQSGPPSYTGKNGEINGEWGWLDGFGWIKTGGSDGGTGGDDSDVVTGGLTGHKVGNM